MPEVEDQHHAKLVTIIGRFMLDRIVEHECIACFPLTDLCADAEPALVGHDQRKVADEPRVGDAVVRRDAGVRRQQGEHCVRRAAGNMRLADPLEERHRLGTVTAIRLDRLAILQQMKRRPGAVPVQLAPLPQRLVLGILNIGNQLRPLRRHQRVELLEDRGRRGFNFGKPGEIPALVELALDQPRIMKMGWLAMVGPRTAHDVAGEAGKPGLFGLGQLARMSVADGVEGFGQARDIS
jgi:hypothetical protein